MCSKLYNHKDLLLFIYNLSGYFRMIIDLEHAEVIYGDGIAVHRGLQLPAHVVESFLVKFFKKLFRVDSNRNCHLCSDPCQFAMTMHLGQPFQRKFKECIPS